LCGQGDYSGNQDLQFLSVRSHRVSNKLDQKLAGENEAPPIEKGGMPPPKF